MKRKYIFILGFLEMVFGLLGFIFHIYLNFFTFSSFLGIMVSTHSFLSGLLIFIGNKVSFKWSILTQLIQIVSIKWGFFSFALLSGVGTYLSLNIDIFESSFKIKASYEVLSKFSFGSINSEFTLGINIIPIVLLYLLMREER